MIARVSCGNRNTNLFEAVLDARPRNQEITPFDDNEPKNFPEFVLVVLPERKQRGKAMMDVREPFGPSASRHHHCARTFRSQDGASQ